MMSVLQTAILWLNGVGAAWAGQVLEGLPLTLGFVIIVWGVCRLGRRVLSPAAACWLWWLACLKVALCFCCVPLLPLAILPDQTPTAPFVRRAGLGQDANAAAPALTGTMKPFAPVVSARPVSPNLTLVGGVFGVWLFGAALGTLQTGMQAVFLWRVRRSARDLGASRTAAQMRRLSVVIGLSTPPGLAGSDDISTPLVVGGPCPVVLLPPATLALSPSERGMILAHELAHLRRGDLWLGLVPWAATLVTFWTPLLGLPLVRRWEAEREAACDQLAVVTTEANPLDYSRLLLKVVSEDARRARGWVGALGATLAFHTLHGRIEALRRPLAAQQSGSRWRGFAAILIPLCGLLFLRPVPNRGQDAPAAVSPARVFATQGADVQDVPAWDIRIGGDAKKRYLLTGAGLPRDLSPSGAPANGYGLLIVLPGGAGGDDFNPFVRRIAKRALGNGYVVAQLIAPRWNPKQFDEVVWPTRTNPWPGMQFSTEDFVRATIRDVSARLPIDPRRVQVLGWASGGPAATAAALAPDVPLAGAFIAMSVFDTPPQSLPGAVRNRPVFVLHPLDAPIVPWKRAQQDVQRLRQAGLTVEMLGYRGGYGWHGDVYRQIRRGMAFIDPK